MPSEIIPINVGVNCFLVKSESGFTLIDTGFAPQRKKLEKLLMDAGCKPGNLNLIILTHGDFDHTGNAAYLREKFGAKIAMHPDDAGMVEHGDQEWNRRVPPDRLTFFGKIIKLIFSKMPEDFDVFTPDVFLQDGQDLSPYGFDARVVHLPGHSKGSVGILTEGGDLFCGDLLVNFFQPDIHFMIDDLEAMVTSFEKMKSLNIRTVYTGHGKSFPMYKILKKI